MHRPRRSRPPRRARAEGFALLALLVLLTLGGLYFLVSNLVPDAYETRQQAKTAAVMEQAREALIGYAVKYRDEELAAGNPDRMYGHIPLPDMGSSNNNNVGCTEEGCDAANFAGNGLNITAIGRFPWRALGTGPLRDSQGECLWYAVSGSHQRIWRSSPMNWDTLSQLDVVVADGTGGMVSAVAAAHERPIAVIFSPGPTLPGQDRSASATDSVSECGGNYVVSNYLDPVLAADLGGVTNYLAGTANNASGDTAAADKRLSAAGVVNRRSDATLWPGNCPTGNPMACTMVANDSGAVVTSALLFRSLRGSRLFRSDINSLLDRMTSCLRDQIATGLAIVPDALAGFTPPTDKNVGRIPTSTCYDDAQNPLGYFTHYRDQIFLATKTASDFQVTMDGAASQTCPAALLFGSQRGAGQSRSNASERNAPANYLEGANLGSFTATGALSFGGASMLAPVSISQTVNQDIVHCVPATASFTSVESPALTSAGFSQIAAYDPATRTLILGALGVNTDVGAPAPALFGCSWTPEAHAVGSGLRSYFKFRIVDVGEGFTFAIVDGDRNGSNVCGAARQHLGYSGNNTATVPVTYPKLAIEIDTAQTTAQQSAFDPAAADTLTSGRSDPDYAGGHVGLVYWGGASPIDSGLGCGGSCVAPHYCSAGACYLPAEEDDNVHGLPIAPDPSARPSPQNPQAVANPVSPAGVNKLKPGGPIPTWDMHVRVEIGKVGLVSLAAVRVATSGNIDLTNPGATLDGIAMASGDRVLVMAQSAPADNGVYSWNAAAVPMTRTSDANSVATLTNASTQVSAGTSAGTLWRQTATITVLGSDTITWTSFPGQNVNRYLLEAWIVEDTGTVTSANKIAAMKNTARPMSLLYATLTPDLRDAPLVYDIQGASCPCAGSQTCGADNMCYTKVFQNARIGFTNSQSTASRDQIINISDFATTWLP